MSRNDDQKIYRTFEEFEREELRRDCYAGSVDEILDEMFAGELDFERAARAGRARATTTTSEPSGVAGRAPRARRCAISGGHAGTIRETPSAPAGPPPSGRW